MGNECNDCLQIINTNDKIKSLWNALNEEKDKSKDLEKRVVELEKGHVENKQKFNQIFEMMAEIKADISEIAKAIKEMQNKPAKTFETLKYEVLKYIVIAGVAIAIAKFL